MTIINRVRPSAEIQRMLITGLIVSDNFCKRILPILESHHITAPFAQTTIRWIKSYFKIYAKAPKQSISDIYTTEKNNIPAVESSTIKEFLESISSTFSEANYNAEYWLDQAIKYIKAENLKLLAETIKAYVETGRNEQAESLLHEYKMIAQQTSKWNEVFSNQEFLDRVLSYEEDAGILQLQGDVGAMLGSFKRNWLVAILAPTKRGKSWFLEEIAIEAYLSRLTVAFICLEMGEEDQGTRILKHVTGLGDSRGRFKMPVFDCANNQDDTCRLPERTNRFGLYVNGRKPTYDEKNEYKPCTFCKHRKEFAKNYIVETWFESIDKKHDYKNKAKKHAMALSKGFGRRLYMINFPVDTATIDDIEAALVSLEFDHGAVPDVIVIDYADIFRREGLSTQGRDQYDEIWKRMKRWAAERHCVVFTASQSNRASMDARSVKHTDVVEDYRKLTHVDVMIGINQLQDGSVEDEEAAMRVRIKLLLHRHSKKPQLEALVLQQLELGQVNLESFCPNHF